MSDKKVINLQDVLRRKKEKDVENLRNELDQSVYELDIEEILRQFVHFDSARYYLNVEETTNDMKIIIDRLSFAIESLTLLNQHEAAEEIEAVIHKLINNSYDGDDHEC